MKIKQLSVLVLALAILIIAVTPALAKGPKAGFGELYHEGDIVRTIIPPAAAPKTGLDDLYAIPGGVEGL